jgi:hypothetical protein
MVACSGDRQGAFGHLLAADVDEIQVVLGVAVVDFFESAWYRIDFQGAGHKRCGFAEIGHGYHFDILDDGCFLRVRGGD